MKFLLASTFINTICLAADLKSPSALQCASHSTDIDSLQVRIMKQYSELLPPFLITCKSWNEDLARAFAIGLALGKQCDTPSNITENNDASTCLNLWTLNEDNKIVVIMKNLQSAISANLKWKDGLKTYNPFAELFDIQEVQNPKNYNNDNEMSPEEVRNHFAKNATNAVAMIALDMALLQWLSHAIQICSKESNDNNSIVCVGASLLSPLCALTLYTPIQEFCTPDILLVLTEFQKRLKPIEFPTLDINGYYPTLMTLLNTLDDGLIRSKVEEIAASIYGDEISFITTRLFLGLEHPFVKSMEEKIPASKWASYSALWQKHVECDFRVYSMGNIWIFGSNPEDVFFHISYPTFLRAVIKADNALEWETAGLNHGKQIKFIAKPRPHRQIRLFVISKLPPPAAFWEEMLSCSDLPKFQAALKSRLIRRMILAYEITILESSSIYHIVRP